MTTDEGVLAAVKSHLSAEETLVLAQAQQRWKTLPGGFNTNMFLGAFAVMLAMIGVFPVANAPDSWFGWTLLALAVLMLCTPFLAARLARGRIFAVTSKRLLILQGGRARTIHPTRIIEVRRRERADGSGALLLKLNNGTPDPDDELFRGIEDVGRFERTLTILTSKGSFDALASEPRRFRREYDEGQNLGGAGVGCLLGVALVPLWVFVSALQARNWGTVLISFLILWIVYIITRRAWVGAAKRAVHFLEVNEEGVRWRIYKMDLAGKLQCHERSFAFSDILAIELDRPLNTGAVTRLVTAGDRVAVPSHLMIDDRSLRLFAETILHYAPAMTLKGDVWIMSQS